MLETIQRGWCLNNERFLELVSCPGAKDSRRLFETFFLFPCLLDVLLASIVLQRSLKLIDSVFRYFIHTHTHTGFLFVTLLLTRLVNP